MVDCTFQHNLVNSGTPVILHAENINLSWKNLNEHEPIPGKYDIVNNDYAGFENPKITIRGYFDIEDIDSNELTQELLTEFATIKSTTPISLVIPIGQTPYYLKGRPVTGYENDGDFSMQNSLNVVIDSFDISLSGRESDMGRFLSYSIVLTEVQ